MKKFYVFVLLVASTLGAIVAAQKAFTGAHAGEASVPVEYERVVDAAVKSIDERPRSEFQDQLLADGQLTEDEYDLAFARFSECVVAGGGLIAGPGTKTSRHIYDAFVAIPPDSDGQPNRVAKQAAADCSATYFDVVGARWSAMHMERPEAISSAMGQVRPCARAAGVELPSLSSSEAVLDYLQSAPRSNASVLAECLKTASAELGETSDTGVLGPIP